MLQETKKLQVIFIIIYFADAKNYNMLHVHCINKEMMCEFDLVVEQKKKTFSHIDIQMKYVL